MLRGPRPPLVAALGMPACCWRAGARTLAAHKSVEALCEREGCSFAALAAHAHALGLDLARLQDHVDIIREVFTGTV